MLFNTQVSEPSIMLLENDYPANRQIFEDIRNNHRKNMRLMQKINRLDNQRASSSFDVNNRMRKKSSIGDEVKSKFKIH